MVVKHCSHGVCRSDSRYAHESWMADVTFHRFPNKDLFPDDCSIWVKACKRENVSINNVSKYTFMCSRHFIDGKGPSLEHPNPITTKATDAQIRRFLQPRRQFQRLNNAEEASQMCPTDKGRGQDDDEPRSQDESHPRSQDESNSCCASASGHLQFPNCDKYKKMQRTYGKGNIIGVQLQGWVPAPQNAIVKELSNHEDQDAENCEDETCVHTHQSKEGHDINFQLYGSPCKNKTHTIDLLSELASPMLDILRSGWNIGLNGTTGIVFTLIDGTTLLKQIFVDINTGLYELLVAGKHICTDGTHLFPPYLSNNDSVLRLLDTFKEKRICAGVGLSRFGEGNSPSSSNLQLGTKCTYLLPPEKGSAVRIRCENCVAELNNLKRKASRKFKSRVISSKRRLKVKLQQYKCKLIKRKLSRDKERVNKRQERGHFVSENDIDAFSNVIHNKTSTKHQCKTNNMLLLMIREQQKAAACNKKGMRWHPEVLKWAAYVRSKSSACYECIRKSGFLCLPSATTLRRVFIDFTHGPGFHTEVLDDMRNVANLQNLQEHQKYVAICMDEMTVKEDIVYNKHSGQLIGFMDLRNFKIDQVLKQGQGCSDEEPLPEVATKIFSLFVRGLTSTFKYAYAHFPSHNLTEMHMQNILWTAIENLENAGFKVLVIIGDGAACNRKFFKRNSYDENFPFKGRNLCASGRDIFFIFDPPHLVKTCRNNLASSNKKGKPKRLIRNKKEMLWSHIVSAYLASQSTKYRIGWKLTREHIFLDPSSKMNVRLAAQVCSRSTAVVVLSLVGSVAEETCQFLEKINDWFDCMNTRCRASAVAKRNANLLPYTSIDDPRLQWLQTVFIAYLDEWKEEIDSLPNISPADKKRLFLSLETYSGLKTTTMAVSQAIVCLLEQGAPYVITSHFNQDILEQEFSKQRHSGGGNDNPTVGSFGSNTRKLNSVRTYIANQNTGNSVDV